MVISFPITPSALTSVKKIQKFLVVSNKARAYISLFRPATFSTTLLITTDNVLKSALRVGWNGLVKNILVWSNQQRYSLNTINYIFTRDANVSPSTSTRIKIPFQPREKSTRNWQLAVLS